MDGTQIFAKVIIINVIQQYHMRTCSPLATLSLSGINRWAVFYEIVTSRGREKQKITTPEKLEIYEKTETHNPCEVRKLKLR